MSEQNVQVTQALGPDQTDINAAAEFLESWEPGPEMTVVKLARAFARHRTRAEPDLVEAAKRIRRHIQHDQSCPHPRNGCGCTCGMIDDDNALRAALTRADV